MKSSYSILRVRGIEVGLHITFILLLPILIFSASSQMGGDLSAILFSGAFFVLLFGSVLMHELVHSLVAIRNGIRVKRIILTPIGGIAGMGEIRDPIKEFKISIAGPLSNFVVGGALLLVMSTLTGFDNVYDAIASGNALFAPSVGNLVVMVMYINLVLGGFNLFLPIFPMDGGRVLRSMLGMITDYMKATRLAVGIGQVFLMVFMSLSLLSGSWWLVAIGIFLFVAGLSELKMAEIVEAFRQVDVGGITTTNFVALSPKLELEEIGEIDAPPQVVYPVLERDGRVLGVVRIGGRTIQGEGKGSKANGRVRDIMEKRFPKLLVGSNRGKTAEILEEIYKNGYAVVVDRFNRIHGILTLENLQRAMRTLVKGSSEK